MSTQSFNMAHAFGVIAKYAKNGFVLYILATILPPHPPPQVSLMPPLQNMKCYIARCSCFHLLLNCSCTSLEKKTVGAKLKVLIGHCAEFETIFNSNILSDRAKKLKPSLWFWTIAFKSVLAVFQKKGWLQEKLESVEKKEKNEKIIFCHFRSKFSIWHSKKSTHQPGFLNPPVHLLSNYMSNFWIETGWVQQKLESVEKVKQKP